MEVFIINIVVIVLKWFAQPCIQKNYMAIWSMSRWDNPLNSIRMAYFHFFLSSSSEIHNFSFFPSSYLHDGFRDEARKKRCVKRALGTVLPLSFGVHCNSCLLHSGIYATLALLCTLMYSLSVIPCCYYIIIV